MLTWSKRIAKSTRTAMWSFGGLVSAEAGVLVLSILCGDRKAESGWCFSRFEGGWMKRSSKHIGREVLHAGSMLSVTGTDDAGGIEATSLTEVAAQ
jgi:hypothetical protein